jgi:uncharacterized membrane protein SpoIIM required for sporulation
MMEWIEDHQAVLLWLALSSALVFIATLVAVPLLLVRIPHDYYARGSDHGQHVMKINPLARAILVIAKNALGYVLIIVGIAMLVLPGQGILAILAGIALVDFPGKQRLERWIVSRPAVLRSINLLRRRMGRPPLVFGE